MALLLSSSTAAAAAAAAAASSASSSSSPPSVASPERQHTASRMPRMARPASGLMSVAHGGHDEDLEAAAAAPVTLRSSPHHHHNTLDSPTLQQQNQILSVHSSSPSHVRYHSTSEIARPSSPPFQSPPRPKTLDVLDFSSVVVIDDPKQTPAKNHSSTGKIPVAPPPPPTRTRSNSKVPAANSRKDVDWVGPPPAMKKQHSYPLEYHPHPPTTTTTTQTWVATQSPVTSEHITSPSALKSPRSSTDSTPVHPRIQPIRGFKPSSRRSTDMASNRNSIDPDTTIRALEGFDMARSPSHAEHEELNSDESDLFLRAAREEELAQRNTLSDRLSDRLIRSDKRRSMITPSSYPSSSLYRPTMSRRRGSDNEGSTVSRTIDERETIGQALSYRPPTRERPSALEDINRHRYYGTPSRSNPTTPRTANREVSPESQVSYGGSRPAIPEQSSARGTSYRQSNLSYSTPRSYHSSPLVSRSADVHLQDNHETPRVADGTESTVSTTAPSTVWDELDELKSRIHRLELTGKLPPTSGAAISRASSERPPTATTTVTTMSSSPKRGRNNSISPIESSVPEAPENHPLLHEALAKSKTLLSSDVFRALEAATADALAISQMMGTSGRPGPLSSQSTVGGGSTVSDRQVRRKADSMCRSLTELCLALSEGKTDLPPTQSQSVRPASRDTEVRQSIEPANNQRVGMSNDLMRAKSSPRALSRLEARRSSLLTGSALPMPRYPATETNTPTQSSMANRRTSLLLRSTRRGTEEPEEDDEMRFRAPSRATTDVGRIRNSPREYVSQQPLPERTPAQSGLPVRRQYTSGTLTNTPPSLPPISSLGGRRFLERATPERDPNPVTSRLADERAQRKPSLGFPSRTGSLNRKTRPTNSHSADLTAGHGGGYQ